MANLNSDWPKLVDMFWFEALALGGDSQRFRAKGHNARVESGIEF